MQLYEVSGQYHHINDGIEDNHEAYQQYENQNENEQNDDNLAEQTESEDEDLDDEEDEDYILEDELEGGEDGGEAPLESCSRGGKGGLHISKYSNMVIVRALKDVIAIKIKARHDSYSDQFSRVFMTKMLLIGSVIMGFDYFSDKVNCMVPSKSEMSRDFVHSACWINGFYIFEEMRDRLEKSGYWGLPRKVDHDGINRYTDELCISPSAIINEFSSPECVPMKKLYYLQYQWMPFYIGALAIIFYLPYIVFRIVNTDLVSLKGAIKSVTCDSDNIVKNYFNYKINPLSRLRLRIFLNVFVKALYIVVNLFALYFTDYLLHGNFLDYGKRYLEWSYLNSTQQHGQIKYKLIPKPGNVLLPSMGFCEILEASIDEKIVFHNKNKFICEISPNILYQYVLIVIWFLIIISIAISGLGLANYIAGHIYRLLFYGKWTPQKTVYRFLSLREMEYLIFIKKKNMVMYGDIVRKLKQQRADLQGKFCDGFETSNGFL